MEQTKVTAQEIVEALAAWYDEGLDGPSSGAYFVDTELTWKEAVDSLVRTPAKGE